MYGSEFICEIQLFVVHIPRIILYCGAVVAEYSSMRGCQAFAGLTIISSYNSIIPSKCKQPVIY